MALQPTETPIAISSILSSFRRPATAPPPLPNPIRFVSNLRRRLYSDLAFQSVDVFAIVALSGIVSRLLSIGTVFVATSDRAPTYLNQDCMQKEIFQKFVAKLNAHCENVLIGSEIDYRRVIAQSQRSKDQVNKKSGSQTFTCLNKQDHYFWPSDSIALEKFERKWQEVTSQVGEQITSSTISVMFGRTLEVTESCNGVARFTFEYLCGRPVGAADYIAVAENYHTVFISGIPVMSMRISDEHKFIEKCKSGPSAMVPRIEKARQIRSSIDWQAQNDVPDEQEDDVRNVLWFSYVCIFLNPYLIGRL